MRKLSAEKFWQKRNGGKSSSDSTQHGEYITPIFTVRLMQEYADIRLKSELIKYDKWMAKQHFGEKIVTAEKIVIEELEERNTRLAFKNLQMRIEFETLIDSTESVAAKKILAKYRRKRAIRNDSFLELQN